MHWAFKYIGKPYKLCAEGPDSYDCWGLARSVFAERLGIAMPQVDIRDHTNTEAMRVIVEAHKWGRVHDSPRDCDALIMRNCYGRHIAVCIETSKGLAFIHASENNGVEVLTKIDDFARLGYMNIEVWRYDARTRN